MAGVFGQVSGSFGASSEFGNAAGNSSNPFAINTTGTTNFPSFSTQGSGFGGCTTNAFGATSCLFGNASNLSNSFSPNSSGTTNFPSFSTQGSGFGGGTADVFGATSSSFVNSSNPTNLFTPNTTVTTSFSTQGPVFGGSTTNVFGATSSSFNASNLSNHFSPNTTRTTNFPSSSTQGSGFGSGTTSVFGATSSSFGNASNLLAPNTAGTTNFTSLPTQRSVFGGSTVSVFGVSSSSLGTSREGNASSSSNPFSLQNQGSFWSGAANVFGAPSSSSNFSFGQTSGSTNSNHNASLNAFGAASSPSSNPFAPSTFGTTTSPSFTSNGSFFGGNSTGEFGVRSASSPSFTFGKPAAIFKSSTVATTSIGSHGPNGSTSGGAFRGPSSSLFGQGSGSSASSTSFLTSPAPFWFGNKAGTSGPSAEVGFTSNKSNNVAVMPLTSNFPGTTHANLFSTSSSAASSSLPAGDGYRNKQYKHTIIKEDSKSYKLMSVSGMPFYESKSHEELRWEDYELKYGSQWNSVGNQAQEINNQKLDFCLPSATSSLDILSPSPTNMSTSTFSFPCLPSPDPSPNLSAFHGCHQITASVLNKQPLQNPQLPTQDVGLQPNHLLESVLKTHSPYNGNSASHTIQAPSLWTVPPVSPASTGNNGGASLDAGLPRIGLQQQLTAPGKVMDSIIAVKDPFGSEPARSWPFFGHSACLPFAHPGISSMPVSNKPAKTRGSSYFTSRHHSLKPLALHVRKYHPSTDGPKVPFFDPADDIQYTSKAYSYIVPRENPRSVIAASTGPTHVSAPENEASPLNHSSAVDYEECRDNAKKAQISSSALNSHKDDFSDNAKEMNELLIPKLQRADYYTEPKIEMLASIEISNPGFCCRVKDFVVGRNDYGWVKFHGETNVVRLNLDSLVEFNYREVIVYADEDEKPPVGQGLNKSAEVTLLNVKCVDKTGKEYTSGKMVEKYIEKLKQVAQKQGAEFVSYDPVKGEWKFCVQHF
ncbi:nuclear pore complex protein NUP98B [Spinacia oleracea]|uniref:Nuclear pore complex protein NUP98B n=1 Tax=Spinacia oleracea TaxID=3562 RepID=A0ABM3QWD5_SPIOL|nr:nuclear pore complex protein NUP98B-like [Spinacia oleracea]